MTHVLNGLELLLKSCDGENKETLKELVNIIGPLYGLIKVSSRGIIKTDNSGRIDLFNEGAETIFGYNQSEILGKNVSTLMPEKFAKHHDKLIGQYIGGMIKINSGSRELFGLRKNGEEFPMRLCLSAYENKDGDTHFGAIIDDISKEKQLFQELEDERNLSKEAKEKLELLLASVNHDMGNHLNSISGFTEFLKSSFDDMSDDRKKNIWKLFLNLQKVLWVLEMI